MARQCRGHRVAGLRHSSQGFSLIELMVGLAVLAILIAIAVPSYRSIIAEQRVRATIADLHSAVSLARSEAIKRNRQITLAPASGGWLAGWGIASPVSGQPAILAHTLSSGVGITGPGSIAFSASGRVSVASEFEVSSDTTDSPVSVSCLTLGLDGRASSAKGGC